MIQIITESKVVKVVSMSPHQEVTVIAGRAFLGPIREIDTIFTDGSVTYKSI